MKRAKKIMCLVLAVVLTLSLMSVGVFAASDTSDTDTASVTQTGLISDLLSKLFSSSKIDVNAADGSSFTHGIV